MQTSSIRVSGGELIVERARALEQIAELLGTKAPVIDLVFYENHEATLPEAEAEWLSALGASRVHL